jgi:hypothetical protein
LKRATLAFLIIWLLLFIVLPFDRGETTLGTWLAKGISTFGITLVLWAPVVGTISAIRGFRKPR